MSAFEVNITPTRNKPLGMTEREATVVILAPFTAKAIVTFEEVPILKTARRILNVINTTDEDIKVMLTRSLNPEYNMCLEWTSTIIPGNGCKNLEMVWNPTKEIQCRETIQFTDNRNFRKDVSVILKSIKKTKVGNKRFPTLSSGSGSKFTLKLKSQVPANNYANRKSNVLQTSNAKVAIIQKQIQEIHSTNYQEIQQNRLMRRNSENHIERAKPQLFKESRYNTEFEVFNKSPIKKYKNKENLSPLTPDNASSIFDQIKFTPINDQRSIQIFDNQQQCSPNLEYLASLPTPVNVKTERSIVRATPLAIKFSPDFSRNFKATESTKNYNFMSSSRNNNYKKNNSENDYFAIQNIPKIFIDEEKETTEICQQTFVKESRTISPSRTYVQDSVFETSPRKSIGIPLINNKTFDLKNQTTSCENLSLLQNNENIDFEDSVELDAGKSMKNQVCQIEGGVKKTVRLSAIAETEESFRSEPLRKQNKNNSPSPNTLKRDIKLVGTPLRKCSESLRDLSGRSCKTSIGVMGSMPDLNNMETLQSIEQNRYYYQQNAKSRLDLTTSPRMSKKSNLLNISNESCVSNADVHFNQSEIRAASSRFNLNEIKNFRNIGVISPSMVKTEPVTPPYNKFISPTNKFKTPSKCSNHIFKRNRLEIDSPTSSSNSLAPRPSISMPISPPKRTRFENEFSGNSSFDTENPLFRVVTWKSSQPIKKIRLQKSLSLVRKPITPRKIKEEPRQMLYNTENFLQHYINPDPFAATTILDPFLAATMYLDNGSVHKYEIQFKKWLNALVSMPSELDPNCEEKIDVGRLFNEVRNKELILAPTKEEQSMNYLTKSRMEALRSAAIKLFMSEEMCIVCSKVAVYIKKGAIKIRVDRDLHLDVVMQRTILELLLSFNPLWLRLGLEVVFGEVIHLHSNSDIVALSTFILNRLFRDKFIERKYSKAYTLSDDYRTHMKSFTLEKILFLLIFLDKAKNNRIIKHNPCLFVKKSQYKETKEILLRISSELLASVGDITKELRRLGYVLTHKQCFIDEFDYAFKNLAVDLRDGVRLTRIMEIILLRENLTKQLRCPAISRLQRIFNVNLALKALSDADFKLKGEITAYDIVDGHREKTLSLLWQIIYKFRSPKFIAAATTLQQWWRKNWIKVVICRRIETKREIKRYKAATIIQSFFKGFITRKYFNIYKAKRVNATVCLQKYLRMYLERKRFIKIMNSIIYIQRWYRNEKIALASRSNFLELKCATKIIQVWYRRIKLAKKLELVAPIIKEAQTIGELRYQKAVIIQRSIKSFVIRKKFQFIVYNVLDYVRKNKLEYKSATKIQSFMKMIKFRKEFLQKKYAVLKIQLFWKSYKLRKLERARFLGKRQAAIAIQSFFRSYLIKKVERKYYLDLKRTIISIQRQFRANRLSRIEKQNYTRLKNATVTIQQHFRALYMMRKARNDYKTLLKATLTIQQRFRAKRLCQIQSIEYRKLKHSTITIQSNYKALVTRRKFIVLKEKTILIQQKLRAILLGRKLRYEFVTLQYNVILMQQRFRANKSMKSDILKYTQLRNAVKNIQWRFRAMIIMKKQRTAFVKLRTAVIYIQTRFRAMCLMRKQRAEFLEIKNSVIIIQRRYRANKLMQSSRKEYQALLQSTINIQQRFRSKLLMKMERKSFIALRTSANTIQSKYRALVDMREQRQKYTLLKKSVIIIQQRYRSYKLMKIQKFNYNLLYQNVVKIQRYFRANQLMKTEQKKYLSIKKSTIVIQTRWKALREMHKQREHYRLIKSSTIYIQQKFRACKLMDIQCRKYNKFRQKVIYIQQLFKANYLMKQERTQYLKIRNATLILQSRWRAFAGMRKERENYLLLKKYTKAVQQRYRANKLMQIERTHYENLYISVLYIQQIFKANYLMKKEKTKFIKIKNSVIKIQRWIRATFEMRKQRQKYLLLKTACKKVQEKYRAQKLMQLKRNNFVKLKDSVIIIQQHYRSMILMRECRTNYLKLKQAVCFIEKRYLNRKQLHLERSKFLKMKKYAILIQRKFRSYCQMKKQREEYLKLRNAATIIQQRYRAKIKMNVERKKYLESKNSIERFQVYCRGFLARKRFNTALTPEAKEFIRKRKAAKTIQRYWRGYIVRKKWQNVRLLVIREKIKELKSTVSACNTVRYKISTAVKILNGKKYNVQEELTVLLRLEKLSRTVPHFLMEHSNFIATFCYSIMAQAIRSEIDKQIIELCSRIILNLARYNSTTANTFQESGLVTIAQMLLRWCDKECGIFNTLCTLIWIFSHCPMKNRIIRKFMTTPEAIYMLRETKKLVIRKEKMRQNVRRSSIVPSTPTKIKYSGFNPKALPSLEPDFGIIQGKPYIFVSSVFAFDVVLNNLGIKEIY